MLTDLSAVLIEDSALHPSMLLIYFCLLLPFVLFPFVLGAVFTVLTRRAFLKVVCKSFSILFSVSQIDFHLGFQFCKVFLVG